jgi:outer membrane protein assembly factor BamB
VPYYVNSPPAVAGKFVFIGTWGGEVVSLDSNTGQKRWSQPTNAEIKTSPSVALNSVYVGSWDSNIYSYDYQTGTIQWQMSTPYNLNQCFSLGSEQGYIPTKDSVVCVKLQDGVPLWTEKLDSQIIGELAINEDSVFAVTNNGYLYRLNGKGSKVWSRKIDAPHISRSICIIGSYVCLTNGSILKFYDISTGKLKWQHDNNGINISLPIFSNGRLFFTTDIGSIVSLGFDSHAILSSQNVDLTIP